MTYTAKVLSRADRLHMHRHTYIAHIHTHTLTCMHLVIFTRTTLTCVLVGLHLGSVAQHFLARSTYSGCMRLGNVGLKLLYTTCHVLLSYHSN